MKERKITNQSRDFKGVWIPAEYWLDPNLTVMEIMFITEIDSLDRGDGCFASNNHFADFFGVTFPPSKSGSKKRTSILL